MVRRQRGRLPRGRRAALGRPASFRSVQGTFGVGALVAVAAALGGLSAVDAGVSLGFGTGVAVGPLATVLREAILHLPLAVAPAFGVALAAGAHRGRRRRAAGAILGAVAAFGVAGALFVPVASRPFGVIVVSTVSGAVLAAVLGLPLSALAARRRANGRSSGGTRADDRREREEPTA